uniref:HTH_Tnp_Tc3_1 domain-containing protein n=1 Tax=Heterorhabditis bacteriophora TaxID=37862 RepID=A0A1I7XBN8_HETBA
MSKGKNITPNQRAMIKVLPDQNLSQVQIAKKLKLSRCAIQNGIKHINNRFGLDGKKYVRRRPGEEFMPQCTIPTIKHGGGSVMVWAAFNRNGPEPLHIVEGIMDSTSYVRILENNLLPYVRSQRLGRNWIIEQDNDAKHSSNRPKPSNIKELKVVIKKAWY